MKEGYLGFNFVHTTDNITWFCVIETVFLSCTAITGAAFTPSHKTW